MKDLQEISEKVGNRFREIEGVDEVRTHFENKDRAFVSVYVKFKPDAKRIREFLRYLHKRMPATTTTVTEDAELKNKDYENEHYRIEVTVSVARYERTLEIFKLINQLERNIDNYLLENSKLKRGNAA